MRLASSSVEIVELQIMVEAVFFVMLRLKKVNAGFLLRYVPPQTPRNIQPKAGIGEG